MSKTEITKQDHGNGHHTETTTTHHDSGGTKTVVKDTTDRSLVYDGHVTEVTRTTPDGNSVTKKY